MTLAVETMEKPVFKASNEELAANHIPVRYRDYCAHHFLKWQKCMRREFFHWKCHHDEVLWEKCAYDEQRRACRERDLKIVSRLEGGEN